MEDWDAQQQQRRQMSRRTVDYACPIMMYLFERKRIMNNNELFMMNSVPEDAKCMMPVTSYRSSCHAIPARWVQTSLNKVRHPINSLCYTPQGRRVITGSSAGEFTLWNGSTFNFELLNQAHEASVRCMKWSPSGNWLISGDGSGQIRYWQSSINMVKVLEAHTNEVRALAFSPSGNKFASGSHDATVKVFDFNDGREERNCAGHGWEVKSIDWHQTKGLIVSGSKDNTVKFWDPRTAQCVHTMNNHKNTVMQTKFQLDPNANLLATSSRDAMTHIIDIRQMKVLLGLRGHKDDVMSLAWHPHFHDLITSGGNDGALYHYSLLDSPNSTEKLSVSSQSHSSSSYEAISMKPSVSVPFAHLSTVWALEYHPVGHMLCSGSHDKSIRFWIRARPDTDKQFYDQYHSAEVNTSNLSNNSANNNVKTWVSEKYEDVNQAASFIPGISLDNFQGYLPANVT